MVREQQKLWDGGWLSNAQGVIDGIHIWPKDGKHQKKNRGLRQLVIIKLIKRMYEYPPGSNKFVVKKVCSLAAPVREWAPVRPSTDPRKQKSWIPAHRPSRELLYSARRRAPLSAEEKAATKAAYAAATKKQRVAKSDRIRQKGRVQIMLHLD